MYVSDTNTDSKNSTQAAQRAGKIFSHVTAHKKDKI